MSRRRADAGGGARNQWWSDAGGGAMTISIPAWLLWAVGFFVAGLILGAAAIGFWYIASARNALGRHCGW